VQYFGYRFKFFKLSGVSILYVILIIQEISPICFSNQKVYWWIPPSTTWKTQMPPPMVEQKFS